MEENLYTSYLTCPECQAEIHVPESGIAGLTTDYGLQRLAEKEAVVTDDLSDLDVEQEQTGPRDENIEVGDDDVMSSTEPIYVNVEHYMSPTKKIDDEAESHPDNDGDGMSATKGNSITTSSLADTAEQELSPALDSEVAIQPEEKAIDETDYDILPLVDLTPAGEDDKYDLGCVDEYSVDENLYVNVSNDTTAEDTKLAKLSSSHSDEVSDDSSRQIVQNLGSSTTDPIAGMIDFSEKAQETTILQENLSNANGDNVSRSVMATTEDKQNNNHGDSSEPLANVGHIVQIQQESMTMRDVTGEDNIGGKLETSR